MTQTKPDHIELDRVFIDGQWRESASTHRVDIVNPHTERVIGHAVMATEQDMNDAVAAARRAFDEGPWPRMTLDERRAVLTRAGEILEEQADEISRLIALENGMLYKVGHGHLGRHILNIVAMPYPEPEVRSIGGSSVVLVHEPVGVVGAIVPWNGPLSSVFKVVPAMLTGCTTILKPAPELLSFGEHFANAFVEAGLPPGVLNIVPAEREVAESLVRNPAVDMISFTGSTAAGRRIGAICGENIKRVHLELGGKSASIVLDDVDPDVHLPMALRAGPLLNNGEACVAWSRMLLPESRYEELLAKIVEFLGSIKQGDPFDPESDIGPLVSQRQFDRVAGYIDLARDEGATVVCGGGRPADLPTGYYIAPTILADADNSMRTSREEIFGPVVSVMKYKDLDEAVSIANDSEYGLSGGIITADVERGLQVARRIRSGTMAVNSFAVNPSFPMGGYKNSGIGRCFGPEGTLEYLELKSIAVPDGFTPADLHAMQ